MRTASRWRGRLGTALAVFMAAAPLTSSAQAGPEAPFRYLFGFRSPMRDGVRLSSDVLIPKPAGRYPVVLIRTPYLKGIGFLEEQAQYFARRGYAVVVQDTRGRGDSEGEFTPFFQEVADGYDAVEHIAKQPWSNGRICMIGGSYMGSVQWFAAKARPPHLTCLASTSPAGRFADELPYLGGAFAMQFAIQWLNQTALRGSQNNTRSVDWAAVFQHRPLRTMDEALGRRMPTFREWLDHPTVDAYWLRAYLGPGDFKRMNLPVLMITGLFDADQTGAMYDWLNVEKFAPGAADRRYLIMGPWTHGQSVNTGRAEAGDRKFPASSIIDNNAVILAFFEKYLKQSAATFEQPRVRVYFTGSDVWRDLAAYPVAGKALTLFFASGGAANTAAGDGLLDATPPGESSPSDGFVYDPRDPVVGGAGRVGEDRSKIQQRRDVLVYSTAPLDHPVEVLGEAEVDLYAASDARDTDFTASLSDVDPDGRAIGLGPVAVGVVRARYRDGTAVPSFLVPGRPYRFTIQLGHLAHSFLPGHRIRLEVSSSAFPLVNPNQNTGNPIADDVEWKVARQTIHHSKTLPSALRLPVFGEDR